MGYPGGVGYGGGGGYSNVYHEPTPPPTPDPYATTDPPAAVGKPFCIAGSVEIWTQEAQDLLDAENDAINKAKEDEEEKENAKYDECINEYGYDLCSSYSTSSACLDVACGGGMDPWGMGGGYWLQMRNSYLHMHNATHLSRRSVSSYNAS